MTKDTMEVLISKEQLRQRVCELAETLNQIYAGKTLKIICILKGSVFFCCDLARQLTMPVMMDFMSVSSYGNNTKSSGIIHIKKDLDESIEGEDVLIIEDIVDSGRTLYHLVDLLHDRNPNSIKICTLLSKPERREVPLEIDYVGFEIPDKFVVGYGLDYAQKYRNLPYIGALGDFS